MEEASRFIHLFIILTTLIQICAVTYIIFAYHNPTVPVHISFDGKAGSFGVASDYLKLIIINILVYALTFFAGKYAKIDVHKFKPFNSEEQKMQFEQRMRHKIKIFLQVISANFSPFVTVLIVFVFLNVINDSFQQSIGQIGIVAFFAANMVIAVAGLIWINRHTT